MSDAFGKEYHLWMLVESVVHQVKYSQLCMFKRKCYWEILFSWKKILKRLCHCKWKDWYKSLSNSDMKTFFACSYYASNVHQTSQICI